MNKNDSTFKKAKNIQLLLENEDNEYVIGMNVYSEILTLVSQRMSKKDSLMLLTKLNSNYTLINPDEDTYVRADEFFRKKKSKNVSYSDCVSFALMNQENIEWVLSFDEHFAQQGFKLVGIDRE